MRETAKREKKEIIISENRDFKGVWIPERLYLTREFTPNEKFLLIEIYSLTKKKNRECFANNKHFSDFVGLKENTVQKMMLKFENAGYIKRNYEYRVGTKEIERRTIKLTQKFYDDFINETENADSSADGMENNPDGYGIESTDHIENNPQGSGLKVGEKYNSFKSNNDLSNTDSSITDKYALEDVKRPSSKGDIYASVPEEHKDVPPKKQGRYIPPDYTEEQLIEHIRPTIEDNLKTVQEDCGIEYNPKCADDIVEIVTDFFEQYQEKTGRRHKILPDATLINIMYQYFNPPECLCNSSEPSTYSDMVEEYFDTNFNARGGYDGEVTLSISHFMSDKIRENCYHRSK